MTDPLIDPDRITEIAYAWWAGEGRPDPVGHLVLDYLREVLTPEALGTLDRSAVDLHGRKSYPRVVSGADLYHRIFGEDK